MSSPILAKNARTIMIYKDNNRYTCQVGAVQLTTGEIVVVFNETPGYAHLDFDSICQIRSHDDGETWDQESKKTIWAKTDTFGSDTPSIMQMRDGTLLCNFVMTAFVNKVALRDDFGPQYNLSGMRECDGVWLMRSTDNGATWSPAFKASISPLRWGQPIDEPAELPDGTLLMAVQAQLRARTYQEAEEGTRCSLIRSDNGGRDWEHWSTIAYDPSGVMGFHEPSLGRTADGTLVCMMRSHHQPRRRHQHLWIAYSTNDGESWSRPEPTNLWGYPADLTLLQDGRMLATYGYRRDPWGVRGCISPDGLHWDVANEFVIRPGGIAPMDKVPHIYWHIGYPTTIQLKNGAMLTVDHQWTQEPPYVQYVVGTLWELGA
jgi:sialidase-1